MDRQRGDLSVSGRRYRGKKRDKGSRFIAAVSRSGRADMAQWPPVVTLFGCDRGPIDVLVEVLLQVAQGLASNDLSYRMQLTRGGTKQREPENPRSAQVRADTG